MAIHAVKLGFGDASEVDIDSTIQESNMAYPADSCLLKKLGSMSSKVAGFLNKRFRKYVKDPITVNMKKMSKKARSYFFLPKNVTKEVKNKKLTLLFWTLDKLRELCMQIIYKVSRCIPHLAIKY